MFKISRTLFCKVPKRVTKQEWPKYILGGITELTSLHKGHSNWQWGRLGNFWVQSPFMQNFQSFFFISGRSIVFDSMPLVWGCWNLLLVSILAVRKTEAPHRDFLTGLKAKGMCERKELSVHLRIWKLRIPPCSSSPPLYHSDLWVFFFSFWPVYLG